MSTSSFFNQLGKKYQAKVDDVADRFSTLSDSEKVKCVALGGVGTFFLGVLAPAPVAAIGLITAISLAGQVSSSLAKKNGPSA